MHNCPTVPHEQRYELDTSPEQAAHAFFDVMRKRRSVRMFSDQSVSRETIESLIQTAGSAPSGANKQPWRFVCISDPAIKKQIREGAEAEEREFYNGRANEQWLKDLAPFGTDENKAFLETVPWLIVVFRLTSPPVDSDKANTGFHHSSCQQQVLPHNESGMLRTEESAGRAKFLARAITPGGDGRRAFGAGLLQRDIARCNHRPVQRIRLRAKSR